MNNEEVAHAYNTLRVALRTVDDLKMMMSTGDDGMNFLYTTVSDGLRVLVLEMLKKKYEADSQQNKR